MLAAIASGLIGAASSIFGAKKAEQNQQKQSAQEYERQKEFAQSGIQWKVKDARKAGIAPLAALGGSTLSYSPQSIGASDSGIGAAGQDISRAIHATTTAPGRADAYTRTAQALELERGSLQNDLLRAQLVKLNQPGTGPGIAVDSDNHLIPGQPNSGMAEVNLKPSASTMVTPGVPSTQAGTIPDVHYAQTTGGGYYPVPGTLVKQAIEDMTVPEALWSLRNILTPMVSKKMSPPPHVPRHWRDEWYFDPVEGYKTRRRASNARYDQYFMNQRR